MTHLSRRQIKDEREVLSATECVKSAFGCTLNQVAVMKEEITAEIIITMMGESGNKVDAHRDGGEEESVLSKHKLGCIESGLFPRFVSGPFSWTFVWITRNHLSIFMFLPNLHGLLSLRSYDQQEKTYFLQIWRLPLGDGNREMCSILFSSTTCPRPYTEKQHFSFL